MNPPRDGHSPIHNPTTIRVIHERTSPERDPALTYIRMEGARYGRFVSDHEAGRLIKDGWPMTAAYAMSPHSGDAKGPAPVKVIRFRERGRQPFRPGNRVTERVVRVPS